MQTWPARDVHDAVRHLPHDSATARAEAGDLWDWNHLAANMADLVDLMRFWLDSEYSKWIHDPDSPEAKAAAERRKRVKPPPHPLIAPLAHRPPSVADQYLDSYLAEVAKHARPAPGLDDDGPAVKRRVTTAEFDRAFGLL